MIYHNNKRLEDLRCAIDETLTSYLMALGFNTNELCDKENERGGQ